jgi:alpha-L-rhamnosidase
MNWTAQMIAADQDHDGAPLFRKQFSVRQDHGAITEATLKVSALGVVEPWINGQRVSDDLLTPGWTSYEWRLRYATYDVRHLIGPTTVIGLSLGNGWYRGRLGWTGQSALYGSELGTIAQLELTFADGTTQLILTDETWTAGPSAVTANDLYDGQTIDARRYNDAWSRPDFSGEGWGGVHRLEFEQDILAPYSSPQVTRCQNLKPTSITTSPSGKTLVDFGQNLVGWIRVQVTGPAGTTVTIRHAEVLEHGELGVRPLRSALATDSFILSGNEDIFEPTLTFHGFRYAEISGWPGELHAENLLAVVISSDLRATGTFQSSNSLLNQFHDNVIWGMRGNFVDVPTDCPQRDERLGWTGDIAAFAPTAAFLYDVESFLAEWLKNLALEQAHHDGIIAYVIPDALKFLELPQVLLPVESTAVWSDAGVWVPWALYQAYGNPAILEAQFDSMTSHVRRVESLLSPTGLWDTGFQFGDWLDPDAPPENPAKAKADTGVVATACAYRSAFLVAQAASILHKDAEATEFTALAKRLRAAFNKHYVENGRVLSDCTTVYSLAIVFGLLDPANQDAAGDRLAQLTEQAQYRISTGFAGTPFITDALTMTGHLEDAYKLLLEESCPSWLYPVTMGATTVWERWDSMLPDGTINPGEMTSFNHYALGAVADWLYRVVGGISALTPGYAELLIAPRPGGGLTDVQTSLATRHGQVGVHWFISGANLTVQTDVPEGVGGILRLPGQSDQPLQPGRSTTTIPMGALE